MAQEIYGPPTAGDSGARTSTELARSTLEERKRKQEEFGFDDTLKSPGSIIHGLGALAALISGRGDLAAGIGMRGVLGAAEGYMAEKRELAEGVEEADAGLLAATQTAESRFNNLLMSQPELAAQMVAEFDDPDLELSRRTGMDMSGFYGGEQAVRERKQALDDEKLRLGIEIETINGMASEEDRRQGWSKLYERAGWEADADFFEAAAKDEWTLDMMHTLASHASGKTRQDAMAHIVDKDITDPTVRREFMDILQPAMTAADISSAAQRVFQRNLAEAVQLRQLNPELYPTIQDAVAALDPDKQAAILAADADYGEHPYLAALSTYGFASSRQQYYDREMEYYKQRGLASGVNINTTEFLADAHAWATGAADRLIDSDLARISGNINIVARENVKEVQSGLITALYLDYGLSAPTDEQKRYISGKMTSLMNQWSSDFLDEVGAGNVSSADRWAYMRQRLGEYDAAHEDSTLTVPGTDVADDGATDTGDKDDAADLVSAKVAEAEGFEFLSADYNVRAAKEDEVKRRAAERKKKWYADGEKAKTEAAERMAAAVKRRDKRMFDRSPEGYVANMPEGATGDDARDYLRDIAAVELKNIRGGQYLKGKDEQDLLDDAEDWLHYALTTVELTSDDPDQQMAEVLEYMFERMRRVGVGQKPKKSPRRK